MTYGNFLRISVSVKNGRYESPVFISFTSEHSGTQTIIGRGAGGIETASSILRDLLDIRQEISKI